MTSDDSQLPTFDDSRATSTAPTDANQDLSDARTSATGPRKPTQCNGVDIAFELAESDFGSKLLIKFDYDETVADRLGSISSNHYCWFYNSDDTETVLEDPPAEDCWHINHTTEALTELESTLGVQIPDRLWPASSGRHQKPAVTLTITDSGSRFRVTEGSESARTRLYDELAYRVENYQFTNAYKEGHWDGYERLYDRKTDTAPIGLLPRALAALENNGFTVDVEDRTSHDPDQIDTDWAFDGDLRPYQHDAVEALEDRNGGILALPTGTGKTVTGLRFIHEREQRALILVHTRELLYQWADRVEDTLGVSPGIIGDGNGPDGDYYDEGPVTVATLQTLLSQGVENLLCDYGVVIFDEAHRTSAGEKMHELALELDVPTRVGLTATPWRRIDGEEMKIEGAVGGLTYSANASAMIQSGYLANPVFDILDPFEMDGPSPSLPQPDEGYQQAFRRCIELSPSRNRAIAAEAARLADEGHRVLVNVDRRAQGRLIAAYLNSDISLNPLEEDATSAESRQRRNLTNEALVKHDQIADTNAAFLDSTVPDSERESTLESFSDGDRSILVSTLVKEGVDIPDISAVLLAHGLKSNIETIQTIGRALRPSGDKQPRIVDIADRGNYFGEAHSTRQQTIAEYYDLDQPLTTETAPKVAVPDDAAVESAGSEMPTFDSGTAPGTSTTPNASSSSSTTSAPTTDDPGLPTLEHQPQSQDSSDTSESTTASDSETNLPTLDLE